jgi:hypothetical protein
MYARGLVEWALAVSTARADAAAVFCNGTRRQQYLEVQFERLVQEPQAAWACVRAFVGLDSAHVGPEPVAAPAAATRSGVPHESAADAALAALFRTLKAEKAHPAGGGSRESAAAAAEDTPMYAPATALMRHLGYAS